MNEDKMPLFLINGFLEAGKTQFIKFTMQQDYFQTEGKTLLIVCEEGEEEYDDRCQTYDQHTGTGVYIRKSLILGNQTAADRYQCIAECQRRDFHRVYIDGGRAHHRLIIARRPDAESQMRPEEKNQQHQADCCCRDRNHKSCRLL